MLGHEDSPLRADCQANACQSQQTVVPVSIPDQSPFRAQCTSENSVSTLRGPLAIVPLFMDCGAPTAHGRLLSFLICSIHGERSRSYRYTQSDTFRYEPFQFLKLHVDIYE